MKFLDREDELRRLLSLGKRREGPLAVVYGRRRIGKTRLLIEWVERSGGLYSVADQSSAGIQRRYLTEALATRLPGFASVTFQDWPSFFAHLGREALRERWRGPLVLDELPYLVLASPELPSVLQRFVDHDGKRAHLCLAVAGSSQRMMQGLVLSADAPLFGRASEILDLGPLPPRVLPKALRTRQPAEAVEHWAAWGGIPRYWELAAEQTGPVRQRIDALALDPMGPLHREPDRILLEEIPSALEVRPLLDAIGAGAHRVTEIAGRMGRPATSLARPLERLREMGLVRREVPFGDIERRSKRTIYRLSDPFFRLWFRVVAPHRATLAVARPSARRDLLAKYWPALVAETWEELCRAAVTRSLEPEGLAGLGSFRAASRYFRGNDPEWDIVAESADSARLLLGEVKHSFRRLTAAEVTREAKRLLSRPRPALPARFASLEEVRVLFVPDAEPAHVQGVVVVTARDAMNQ